MAVALTQDARREGDELLHALEAMGVEATGAAWVHVIGVPEETAWRFFVFTPQVDTMGPREINEFLFSHLGWPDQAGALSPLDVFTLSPAERAYDELTDLAAGLPFGEVLPLRAEWRGLHVDAVFPYRLGQPRAGHARPRRERRRSAPGRDAA